MSGHGPVSVGSGSPVALMELPRRLEPVASLALAVHGAVVLAVTADTLRWAGAVAAVTVLAVAGIAGARGPRWVLSRAVLGVAVGGALQLLPHAGGYFLLWFFVIVNRALFADRLSANLSGP